MSGQNVASSSSHWEEFYATHLPPSDYEDNRSLLKEFCARHKKIQNNIVLVTVSKRAIEWLIDWTMFARRLCVEDCINRFAFSREAPRFRSSTTPFVSWTILVPARGDHRRPSTFWSMDMRWYSCIGWSRWSRSRDTLAGSSFSTCSSWATMGQVQQFRVKDYNFLSFCLLNNNFYVCRFCFV